MHRESAQLKGLAVQKRLLVAESEILRAELGQDWQSLREGAESLAEEVHAFRTMASGGAKLVATGIALKELLLGRSDPTRSWASILMKGAGAGMSIWQALRGRSH